MHQDVIWCGKWKVGQDIWNDEVKWDWHRRDYKKYWNLVKKHVGWYKRWFERQEKMSNKG